MSVWLALATPTHNHHNSRGPYYQALFFANIGMAYWLLFKSYTISDVLFDILLICFPIFALKS